MVVSYKQLATNLHVCTILSFLHFTQWPSRHGPSVTIKLPVVYQASTLLMISIYLTIILVSRQSILTDLLMRNSRATHMYLTSEFYFVAELYCVKAEHLCYTTKGIWMIYWNLYIQYIHICIYGCSLHLMTHKNILPGGPPVGMGRIDDDVAIWCTWNSIEK